MAIIIGKVDVNWVTAFEGYIPSKHIFKSGGLYTCKLVSVPSSQSTLTPYSAVGILGATVMPHSLFLGSALATQDRISPTPEKIKKTASITDDSKNSYEADFFQPKTRRQQVMDAIKEFFCAPFRAPDSSEYSTLAVRHSDRENKPLAFVKAHIYHAIVDVVSGLLGFAVLINSMSVLFAVITSSIRQHNMLCFRILILASAVFFYGGGSTGDATPASLFDAYDLIRNLVGQGQYCFIDLKSR